MKQKFFALLLLVPAAVFSQQKITLAECETAFVRNNMELLAEQYNIPAQDAEVLHARIWDLPEISFESNLIRPSQPSFFNIGAHKELAVEQLFLLGGKRRNEIALAKSNRELAVLQLEELLVNLQAELRENFYALFYEHKKLGNIDDQLVYMNELLEAYRIQTSKGNIALRDQVRLQAIVMALSADRLEVTNEITERTRRLATLLGTEEEFIPDLSQDEEESKLTAAPLFGLPELQEKARAFNPGYRYAVHLTETQQINYKLQKSLITPDLTAGLQWNQNSGIFHNEVNFSVGIPLPLWKKNAGNVELAKVQIIQAEQLAAAQRLQLDNEVAAAYKKWEQHWQFYANLSPQDWQDMQTVYRGILKNFRSGNVTLLDFTDFIDSYRETALQRYEMKKQIMITAAELSRLTQNTLFK
ncbi:TolC family protein [Chryseobacterium salipaludis]|uniref:TolC family protein n=1 Tax=Chryseobacterium TaxID=59732 RepID=UPI001FF5C87E|nr:MULTISPECIES: TolC family protein [Chryseobacterium]MCJ8498691.1 TolC family protein [Chryseobacterium salipaludis]MCX3297657.1 TolC family protein [Planobacterium sp. JC490]